MIELTVYGTPGPQGSKKLVGRDRKGRGVLVESSKKVKPWREAVVWAAREHGGRVAGPVELQVVFTLARPESAPKKRQWPDRRPDLSKLVRSTEDALTDAGAWEDDARVVMTFSSKVYVGDRAALEVPGAMITIRRAE